MVRNCAQCGKEFRAKASLVAKGESKYCSRPCMAAAFRRPSRVVDCGTHVEVYARNTGNRFIFDAGTFDQLAGVAWREYGGHLKSYRYRHGEIQAYRLLFGPEADGREVDHKNRDPYDNRRDNLRLCTHGQNMFNAKLRRDNRSGFKGASYNKNLKKWGARIHRQGRRYELGWFASAEEAARAYDRAAILLFGEFAATNEMLGLLPKEGSAC